MSRDIVSAADLRAAPIANQLARDWADSPGASVTDLYAAAVETALSFSTGSADAVEFSTPGQGQAEAEELASAINGYPLLRNLQEIAFPQAIVGRMPEIAPPPSVLVDTENGPLGKPARALWTSSFVKDRHPAWSAMVDTGYLPFGRPFGVVEFHVDRTDVAIYTISRPPDFAALCDRYAEISSHDKPQINWRRVAETYDAVHLTFTGLLLVQENPIWTRLGAMTLRGWDSEGTAWLNLPASARLGERYLVE